MSGSARNGPKGLVTRYLGTAVALTAVTGLGFPLSGLMPPTGLGAIYLVCVCWITYVFGRAPGVVASIVATLLFLYCFVSPYYSFQVNNRAYLLTFFALLGASLAISSFTARAREQTFAALAREHEAVLLLEFSRALSDAQNEDEIWRLLTSRLSAGSGAEVRFSPLSAIEDRDYVIRGRDGVPLGFLNFPEKLTAAQQRTVETLSLQAALAVERERLAQRAHRLELDQATERLQTALLNSISHDFRSPLVAIQGALQSLELEKDGKISAADRELLVGNALVETDRLNCFVANLRQMTRLESGHLALKLEEQDPLEVIEGTLGVLRRPPRVQLHIAGELPLIMADFVLLRQALWNLVENALKFAPTGPVILSASASTDRVEISVRDFGPGIPEEEHELVFTRFYRGAPAVRGSGLGLPICRGLLRAMGGSVHVESAQPGARFVVQLQVAQVESEP
jgi:two-component system, OmpR family, sensor histidine kinase KdpD